MVKYTGINVSGGFTAIKNQEPFWVTGASLPAETVGDVVSLQLQATDPEGAATKYRITSGSLPDGLSMDVDGLISGTTIASSVGTTNFTVRAIDNYSAKANRAFTFEISNNNPTWVTGSNLDDMELSESVSIQLEATDPDLHTVTYSEVGSGLATLGLSMNSSGLITGTAPASASSGNTFEIQADDGFGGTSNRTFTVDIIEVVPFATSLYTGNGSTQSITGVGFQPDLVWIKYRSGAAQGHALYDSERGVNKNLDTSDSSSENASGSQLTSFDSDGFSVGSSTELNENSRSAVAWSLKKNASLFDIVTYTGNGVAGNTISHNLNTAPSMIISKKYSDSADWIVYHENILPSSPEDVLIKLNLSGAKSGTADAWNQTAPTSSNFQVGPGLNDSGQNYVAYLFAEKAGSTSFGVYTGNGSTTGPVITTGFQPRFVLIKSIDNVGNWVINDSERGDNILYANSSLDEGSIGTMPIDFNPANFQIKTSQGNVNANGDDFIYMAIK